MAKLCHRLEVRSGVTWFGEEVEAPQTVTAKVRRGPLLHTPALISTVTGLRRPLPSVRQEPSEFPELQQLLRRRNGAVLQRDALRKQRDDLRQENQQLRRLLRQRLDAAAVDGNTIRPPPLSMAASRQHAITHQAAAVGHAHLTTASPPL